jgi:hypothetical protein
MSKCYFCGDTKAGCPECHAQRRNAQRRNAQQRQAVPSSFERDTVKPLERSLPDDFTTYVNPDHAMKAPTISEMEESIARIEALFPKPPEHVMCRSWYKSPAFDALELGRPDPLADIAYRVGQWHAKQREEAFAHFMRTLPGIFLKNTDDSTAGQLLGGVLDDSAED